MGVKEVSGQKCELGFLCDEKKGIGFARAAGAGGGDGAAGGAGAAAAGYAD